MTKSDLDVSVPGNVPLEQEPSLGVDRGMVRLVSKSHLHGGTWSFDAATDEAALVSDWRFRILQEHHPTGFRRRPEIRPEDLHARDTTLGFEATSERPDWSDRRR